MSLKIDVLGTKYEVRHVNSGEDDFVQRMNLGGYCNSAKHEIVILNLKSNDAWKDEPDDVIERQENETIRHELIHAFLNESGMKWNSVGVDHWAMNEEMIDWIAIQFPKIVKAFEEAGCIE